jgi:uncharacterized protein (DUF305 family)
MKFEMMMVTALLVCAVALPAAAQQMAPMQSPEEMAFAAAMAQMDKGMAGAKMTGNADQDFVVMMIPHHQGAIAMAQAELQYGTDPALRQMAQDIIGFQTTEINEMKAWQKEHPAGQ